MIESKLPFKVGTKFIPLEGAVSRIVSFRGDTQEMGAIKGAPPNPVVAIQFRDYESLEAAQKVYVEQKSNEEYVGDPAEYSGYGKLVAEERTRVADLAYNPEDPEHVAQYEAAGSPDLEELDADGNPWKPTVYETYNVYFEVVEIWQGATVGEPIQDREFKLPLTQAIQVLMMAVPGKNPEENYNELVSALYRAAMLSGEFPEAKAV